MDATSEKRLTVIGFRAVGILVVLIGLILATTTIISLIAVSSLKSNIPAGMNINIKGPVGTMGVWAILAQISISAWGAAVYFLADRLSDLILSETTGSPTIAANS